MGQILSLSWFPLLFWFFFFQTKFLDVELLSCFSIDVLHIRDKSTNNLVNMGCFSQTLLYVVKRKNTNTFCILGRNVMFHSGIQWTVCSVSFCIPGEYSRFYFSYSESKPEKRRVLWRRYLSNIDSMPPHWPKPQKTRFVFDKEKLMQVICRISVIIFELKTWPKFKFKCDKL
jgi:hypothetical protein